MDKVKISPEYLTERALEFFSDDQISYIDEFTFFQLPTGEVECWYAGELLSVFDGRYWNVPLHQDG